MCKTMMSRSVDVKIVQVFKNGGRREEGEVVKLVGREVGET